MLDAYTVRKAIPRIVFAVIAINLSIYFCIALIDITEVVGRGINQLLVGPFVNSDSFSSVGASDPEVGGILGAFGYDGFLQGMLTTIFGLAAFAGAALIGLIGLLGPLLITITLIVLAVLFTLVIRQGLLVFLIIVSPIAFVCYVLPGTEKYFKSWLDLFTKTLLIYPIIAIIFAMSNVLGAILLSAGGSGGSMLLNPATTLPQITTFAQDAPTGDALKILVVIVIMYAPLFLIPFAFKMAGGAIGQIGNMATKGARIGGGRLGGKMRDSEKDPDSVLGKAKFRAAERRVNAGLTGRQVRAALPGRNRDTRMAAAKLHSQKKLDAVAAQSFGMKSYAQDSDVMNSMTMTKADVDEDRGSLKSGMAAAQQKLAAGEITQEQYNDKAKESERKLTAHSIADRLGRSEANQRAAYLNGDRIKYATEKGQDGYNLERKKAERIFGGGAATAEAMNAFQGIASSPQVGRADLAGALYGQEYDTTRSAGKVSAGQVLQGHVDGVKGVIAEQTAIINDTTVPQTDDEAKALRSKKVAAVQMLTSLQANAASPYGGNEGSKLEVKNSQAKIDEAYEAFKNDPNTQGSYYHGEEKVQPTPGAQTTIPHPGVPNATITVTNPPIQQPSLQGPEAALARIKREAGRQPDQAQIANANAADPNQPPPPDPDQT
ncbi:MAG: hypothetical protein ACR2FM_00285 [Candidatus Saccharimonadales bacterium]